MSVKNANILGVYVQTDADSSAAPALEVVTSSATDLAGIATALTTKAAGTYVHKHSTSGKAIFVLWDETAATEMALDLVGCATNTTLDISNSINETVCRNGAGGSTKHIVSGATAWTISVDGLFGEEGDTDSNAPSLIALANDKQYVICKFKTSEVDASSVTYVGQALIESVSLSGGVDEIATYSVSLNGHSDLYVLDTLV